MASFASFAAWSVDPTRDEPLGPVYRLRSNPMRGRNASCDLNYGPRYAPVSGQEQKARASRGRRMKAAAAAREASWRSRPGPKEQARSAPTATRG